MTGGELYKDDIEDDLDGNVEEVDLGQWEPVNHHGAEGVEEDLEGTKEGLTKD